MLPSVRQFSVRLHRARRLNQVVRLSRTEVDLLLAALRANEESKSIAAIDPKAFK
jgi:hypothetical protein